MKKHRCVFCGKEIVAYEPGTSLSEEYGFCHTECLYSEAYGEEVPEVLK